MRIVIDMQGAQTESRFRGIGRYTLALTRAIVRNRGEHEVILALSGYFPETIEPIRAAFHGLLPQEHIRVWYGPRLHDEHANGAWCRQVAELIREAFIASLKPDLVHISSLFEGYGDAAVTSIGHLGEVPVSVSLYDLIPLVNSSHYLAPNPAYEAYYRRKLEHLGKASLLLAISEFSRQECLSQLGVPIGSVVNISTAVDPCFRSVPTTDEEAKALLGRFGLTRPFVLYSGGADDRKNLPRLIRAYSQLSPALRERHQLVSAGKMPEDAVQRFRAVARSAGLRDDELVFTGFVSDDDLVRLYNLCKLFVLPSWHEGFGLPALEAMACGAPVIGASTSSVPEVIGRADALFDPFEEADITRKLTQVLKDDVLRSDLISHGLERAKDFSWDKSGRLALAAFEHLHSQRGQRNGGGATERALKRLVDAVAEFCPIDVRNSELVSIADAISRIPDNRGRRQLFVDISELAQRDARTGIQRVTRSILKELMETPPEGYIVRPVYAETDSSGYRYARRYIAAMQGTDSHEPDELIEYEAGDVFLGLDLQHHVVLAQQDYLRGLRADGVKVVFVIYDLLPLSIPDAFPAGSNAGHEAWLQVLAGFDGVICISRAVAEEFRIWLERCGPQRLRPLDIDWFHLGADVENSVPTLGMPGDASYVVGELAKRTTFLTVGTVEPRKGQGQVLRALELLWERGVPANLVIVGKQGWMVDELADRLRNHPELGKRLFWLEGISDEYLENIYSSSTCLIAASQGEGFGLPLIEAAQHNLPIIARDIPVFREVAGAHAYYFSGLEAEDLVVALEKWLHLYSIERHPRSAAMPWLTWKQSATMLVEKVCTKGGAGALTRGAEGKETNMGLEGKHIRDQTQHELGATPGESCN